MGLLNIIRRMHKRQKLWIREIARLTGVSRNTVITPVPPTAAAAVSEIDGSITSGTNAGAASIGTTSSPLRA